MIRTLRLLRLLRDQHDLIRKQRSLIELQEHLLQRVHLDYNRELQSVVVGWILSHEQPEIDLSHDLSQLDRDIADRISQLEEHVV